MPATRKTSRAGQATAAVKTAKAKAAKSTKAARGTKATTGTKAAKPLPATRAKARGAPASPVAATTPSLPQRRTNRKHVLDALNRETDANGGKDVATRVIAFRNDPHGGGREHFVFVGGLQLFGWYIDPARPTASEARSLWHEARKRLGKPVGNAPAGISGQLTVVGLQTLAEQMP